MPLLLLLAGSVAVGQDLSDELKTLQDRYEKDRVAFLEAEHKARTPEEKARVRAEHAQTWIPRFKEVARRAGGETAASALLAALNVGWDLNDGALVKEAADALASEHVRSPQLEQLAGYLQGGSRRGWTWPRDLLRSLSGRAEHPTARTAMRFSLGCVLLRDPESSADDHQEGRTILEHFRKELPGTDLARQADAELFEFDHLRVGRTLPDFEAADQDGRAFRLSEYRGKVVVLSFWGFW